MVTVTYCNEITAFDQLSQITTLWEEEEGHKEGRRKGGGGHNC